MVSEQALINWSETRERIHITAKVIRASWEAALHKWCQVLLLALPKDGKGDGPDHVIVQVFNFLKFSLQNSSIMAKRQILVFLLSTFRHVLGIQNWNQGSRNSSCALWPGVISGKAADPSGVPRGKEVDI